MNLLEEKDACTAASMFDNKNNLFEWYTIQWDHFIGIGLDNRNANIRERNSIKYRARQKNDNIIIAGCVCHTFNNITGFDKPSRRKCALKEYYEFRDLEYAHVIKFISTRWLCLELYVNRELKILN